MIYVLRLTPSGPREFSACACEFESYQQFLEREMFCDPADCVTEEEFLAGMPEMSCGHYWQVLTKDQYDTMMDHHDGCTPGASDNDVFDSKG